MGCCCVYGQNNVNFTDKSFDISKIYQQPYYVIAIIYPNNASSISVNLIEQVITINKIDGQTMVNYKLSRQHTKIQKPAFSNLNYKVQEIASSLYKGALCCGCCCPFYHGTKAYNKDYSWFLSGINKPGSEAYFIYHKQQFVDPYTFLQILAQIQPYGYTLDTHFLEFPEIVQKAQFYSTGYFKSLQTQGKPIFNPINPAFQNQQQQLYPQYAQQQMGLNPNFVVQQNIDPYGNMQQPLMNTQNQKAFI